MAAVAVLLLPRTGRKPKERTVCWPARLSSLEGCTVSNRGQRPRTAGNSFSISLEGYTPAKMAARAAAPKAHATLSSHRSYLPLLKNDLFLFSQGAFSVFVSSVRHRLPRVPFIHLIRTIRSIRVQHTIHYIRQTMHKNYTNPTQNPTSL